jgi:hypothetical protein
MDPAVAYKWSRHVLATQADRLVLRAESRRSGACCDLPRGLQSRHKPIGQSLQPRCSPQPPSNRPLGIILYPHGFWPGPIFCSPPQGRCANRRIQPTATQPLYRLHQKFFLLIYRSGIANRRSRPQKDTQKVGRKKRPGVSTRSLTLSQAHCRPRQNAGGRTAEGSSGAAL